MSAVTSDVEKKVSEHRINKGFTSGIIYVPQGYCAKFMDATNPYGLNGLYTDSFSSCNIVVCIGKKQISLAHFDFQNSTKTIQQQIELTSDPSCKVIILYRQSGDIIKKELLEYLGKKMPSQIVISKQMDDQHEGIYVSLNSASIGVPMDDVHPGIKKFPIGERPEGLIHHPQEQQLLAVRKIEQLIGLRARYKTEETRKKLFLIFDGICWEPLDKAELSVDVSHNSTREEMEFFSKEDPFITITGKLAEIVKKIKAEGFIALNPWQKVAMSIASHLEGYLNDYDYELLFKRNLGNAINSDLINKEQSLPQDKIFQKKLNETLAKPYPIFEETRSLLVDYMKTPPTAFKKQFLSEYKIFRKHYEERKYYANAHHGRLQIKEEAKRVNAKAISAYKEENYSEAFQLFSQVLTGFTQVCLKSNPELASVFFNLGKCLLKAAKFESAIFFLRSSLILKQNYIHPKPRVEEVQKIEDALIECQQKLTNISATQSVVSQSRLLAHAEKAISVASEELAAHADIQGKVPILCFSSPPSSKSSSLSLAFPVAELNKENPKKR